VRIVLGIFVVYMARRLLGAGLADVQVLCVQRLFLLVRNRELAAKSAAASTM